jgi:hypothetical protein
VHSLHTPARLIHTLNWIAIPKDPDPIQGSDDSPGPAILNVNIQQSPAATKARMAQRAANYRRPPLPAAPTAPLAVTPAAYVPTLSDSTLADTKLRMASRAAHLMAMIKGTALAITKPDPLLPASPDQSTYTSGQPSCSAYNASSRAYCLAQALRSNYLCTYSVR